MKTHKHVENAKGFISLMGDNLAYNLPLSEMLIYYEIYLTALKQPVKEADKIINQLKNLEIVEE